MSASRPPRTGTAALVEAAVRDSGLSAAEWARTVAGRDVRTIQRWLAGEPIPSSALAWLTRLRDTTTTDDRVTVTVAR